MAGFDFQRFLNSLRNRPTGGGPPPRRPGGPVSVPPGFPRRLSLGILARLALAAAVVYGAYFWLVRRQVVDADEVLVLLRKDGNRSLPGDQVVIPNPAEYPGGKEAWDQKYGDTNGIWEQVYLTGTYFGFSPFDYERQTFPIV